MKYETFIKDMFSAWQTRDWGFVDRALANGFAFTSPYDDHIDKVEYRHKCWDAVKEIEPYDFINIMEQGDDAYVHYKGKVNGVQVQNVEHFLFDNGKIKGIT